MSHPVIRPADHTDAPTLARLRFEFRAGQNPAVESEADFLPRCTAWMEGRLLPGGSWRCWLAEDAGRAVGTVWLHLIEKLPNPVGEAERHGYVSSLYVHPAFRGQGLGNRLLGACLESCLALGVDAVILWPTPRSRSLYHRHGFEVREDLLERRLTVAPAEDA